MRRVPHLRRRRKKQIPHTAKMRWVRNDNRKITRSGGLLLGLVLRRGWLGISRRLGLRLLRRGWRWRLATRGRGRFVLPGDPGGGGKSWCPRLELGRLASRELRRRDRLRVPWRPLRRRRDFLRRHRWRRELLVRRFRGDARGWPLPGC